jgi:hypothetical protein
VAVAAVRPSFGAGPPGAQAKAPPTAERLDTQELAGRIDKRIARRWAAKGVKPAASAADGEFLRRVSLDLAGRIPAAADVRAFLDDKSPNKRQRLVERLLKSPEYAQHFANVWRELLLPPAADPNVAILVPGLETWLRRQLRENTPSDRIVRELLTAPLTGQTTWRAADGSAVPFYLANEAKPERLAGRTARVFLGVQVECAQCHDHPFARWKKQQFWEFAAFFAGVSAANGDRGLGGLRDIPNSRTLNIPGTQKQASPRFLDGSKPAWGAGTSGRALLAGWLTSPENPYFARNVANRLWAHFFGSGLQATIDPLDGSGPAAHAELLDELARQLAAHGFDLRYLIRAITTSKVYQLSSAADGTGEQDPTLFARMAVKGMTAEQLWDSLAQATGYREPAETHGLRRTEFLARFAAPSDKRTEQETSVLQALALMNGRLTARLTRPGQGKTLEAVLAPGRTTAQRIEALYLATLSRRPRPEEARQIVAYVDKGGADGDPGEALADVFWVLLNSSEFVLNH